MNTRQNLQHLLPDHAREELIVLTKRSFQLSTISISILTLGAGIAIGTLIQGSTRGGIALVLCFIGSRILGAVIQKHEDAALERFESRPGS